MRCNFIYKKMYKKYNFPCHIPTKMTERYRFFDYMTGKVKMFNKEKGYGFITIEGNRDVFFHYSELVMEGFKTIDEGSEVEFELIETDRGPQAKQVVKL